MRVQLCLLFLWTGGCVLAGSTPAPTNSAAPGAEIFNKPTLLRFQIALSAADADSLRRAPRAWVPADVLVDGRKFARVGLHIKGAQGSLRPFDEKPALTLRFGKFDSGQRLLGLRKIHLNNSARDPTYLCEDLAGELFRRAGVPAPRVAWATVELNERKLGLYVLKEGFSPEFLGLHFTNTHGNLYDGGLHREISEPLELESGDGPKDHADLRALADAAAEPDATRRWQRLTRTLDVDRFVSFMAMEVLAGHFDGYCLMQNNYRVYFDPAAQRAVFLPHGTDRMFYEPQAPVQPPMRALVANAVMTTPEGVKHYRQRLAELAGQAFQAEWMTNRINAAVRLLDPVEPLVTREAQPLTERVVARAEFLRVKAALPGRKEP